MQQVHMIPTVHHVLEIYSEAPVFSNARDIGSMAAINTILSQLIVL